ncbi:hypothetical protein HanXRQr2_Chr15g0680111 [Helianthus annuus]|uniref:Uncharacterized protein n=1 Tax=Helianthus annuus TaxID=4232 RepID=A0A9K3DZW3_HELAN|nr:hypothetical protein HanXRQr2_Chr15g0680111 [Helianthus annuus]KAJ0830178.1 hypothetical protein HanPSC8_Chr15g0652221 [Helianthus annuus]
MVKAAIEKTKEGLPFIHPYMDDPTHQDPCSYHRITYTLFVFDPKSNHGPLFSWVINYFYLLIY